MPEYSLKDLSRFIDHTNLKPDIGKEEISILCKEAIQYQFKMVAVNQVQSELCKKLLENSDIHVGAAISFPLGQTSIESKVFETEDAIKNGATEIDYVINLTEVKNKNWDYLEIEMKKIVELCRQNNIISKAIFENAYLTDEEKVQMCHIAKKVQPDFIKTSTGFAPTGATFEDVKLMKTHVGKKVKVKAAGGIRDLETFKMMIACGAERIGTSSGIKIMEDLKKELQSNQLNSIHIDLIY